MHRAPNKKISFNFSNTMLGQREIDPRHSPQPDRQDRKNDQDPKNDYQYYARFMAGSQTKPG
jgi:hypothetical protein